MPLVLGTALLILLFISLFLLMLTSLHTPIFLLHCSFSHCVFFLVFYFYFIHNFWALFFSLSILFTNYFRFLSTILIYHISDHLFFYFLFLPHFIIFNTFNLDTSQVSHLSHSITSHVLITFTNIEPNSYFLLCSNFFFCRAILVICPFI